MIEIDRGMRGSAKLFLNPKYIVAIESNDENRCIVSTVGGKVFHVARSAKEVSLAIAGYPIRNKKESQNV